MSGRGSFAKRWLGIALACVMSVAPAVPARAGCNISDFDQAFIDSVADIPFGCASNFSDGDFWYLVMAIQIASNVSSASGPDYVSQACSDVGTAIQTLNDVSNDISKVQNTIDQVNKYLAGNTDAQQNFQQFLDDNHIQDALQEGQSDTQSAINALNYFHCACQVVFEKRNVEINADVNACLSEALCDVTAWLNQNVSSAFNDTCPPDPPPPPTQVACSQQDPLILHASGVGSWPGCAGDYCFDQGVANNYGGSYCYCPQAMQHVSNDVYGFPGEVICSCPNGMTQQGQFVCACPQGITQTGAYECTCKNGQSILPDGTCPVAVGDAAPPQWKPTCGLNQVAIVTSVSPAKYSCNCDGGFTMVGGNCVSACAAAGQVMTSAGACCSPSQVTACGTCCPQGQVPNGSTCVTQVKFTPTQHPTLKPSNTPLKPLLPSPAIKP
jgi:hypothetical protein